MPIDVTCQICSKIFTTIPAYAPYKKYCSLKCKHKAQSKLFRGSKHWNYVERVQIKCQVCSKPMLVTPWYVDIKKYCSRKCKAIIQSSFMSGSNNPSWHGGISEKWQRWGKNFTTHYKKQIKDRDNHTCQNCGVKEGRNRIKFVIHHLDNNPKNGKKSNLQLLCNSCHMSIHQNSPK